MQSITNSTIHKRMINIVSFLTIVFSSTLLFGANPISSKVNDTNKGIPFLYTTSNDVEINNSISSYVNTNSYFYPFVESTENCDGAYEQNYLENLFYTVALPFESLPSGSLIDDMGVNSPTLESSINPTPRDCDCAPIYKDSNFESPKLIGGKDLSVGAVYRFTDVFPTNPYNTEIDALVKIEEFSGGANLLEIDVTSSGLPEAFQPRINSTNSNDQSVLFSITFVESGGNYGDEVEISVYGTPLDIDGDESQTREYAEVNLPDAYFINNNTLLNMFTGPSILRGEASTVATAPGGDVSLDPRFTFSSYWENVSSINYRIGKIDGDDDRYYSFNLSCADYNDPNSVLFTYPVICGNVSDEGGGALVGVEVDVTGTDGSSQTVVTDSNGNYKAIAEIPENMASVVYEIRENDLPGYISISDVDGDNDNLITREIELASSCGNDFVDGFEPISGWNFVCGDDKIVEEYGFNANCETQTVAAIPDASSIYQYVVEIVYKGGNPGQTLSFTDSDNVSHSLNRSVPVGTSSNIWVYRGLISGSTSSITYNTTSSLSCKLQSLVVYAFRVAPGASSSSGLFTSRSGVNDIQTITIDIPAFTGPRNLFIETPISELTNDGRYLLLKAEAGGVSDQVFLYGSDPNLPPNGVDCCLSIPMLTLPGVPGNITQVVITVDTRNGQNGQSVNGQSWVIASGVNVDGDCFTNTTDAINDINNTFVDVAVPGNVLTNDEDAQGDNQIVTTTGTFPTTAGGSVTLNADGSYVYTPPAGYAGPDTFDYSIEDDGLPIATDTATVFIEVLPLVPNTTIANADTAGTLQDQPVSGNVLTNDFDPEGDNQTVTNVGTFPTTQGGSITIAADGSYTYTPPAGFTGEDTFEYFITDDNINPATDSAILAITVLGSPGNVTFANDDAYNGNQGATITGNVLDNDTDPQGDTQMVDIGLTPISGPSNGTLSINADGSFTYIPNDPNFFGTDQFVYEIFDDGTPEARDQATVIITVFGINTTDAINDINNTFVGVAVPGNVLTNDEDAQGDNQIVTTTGTFPTTAGGSVTLNADGSYVYTPPAGYAGPDTFDYSIEDDGNPVATDTATVFIEVLPLVPNTTIANADTAGTLQDQPVSGNVLTNDFDPEGDNQTVTNVGTFPTTQGGSITIAADGSYTYTPPAGFTGEDTFEYFITDDNINPATDSAILAITVLGSLSNVTFANDDAYNGNQGATITGNVLDNDTDPQGDTQMVDIGLTPISGPSNGTLSINADGSFTYIPNDPNFFGTDQFVYEIFDDGTPEARDQATVIITVFGINTTDAINDINNTFVGVAVPGNVLTNDEDAQGDNQIVTTTGTFPTTAGGSVTLNADGSYVYTPPAGYAGPDTFDYSIEDDGNPVATDTATVFIEVLPLVPNTTIANADTAGTLQDQPVSGNVLTNDFDPEGDNQIVTNVGTFPTTQGGSITIAADGSYTYTPPAGFTGEDTFEYFITDDNINPATDSAILAITVLGSPGNVTFANDDAYNGNQGATITGNVLDNDTDPQGDTQMVDIGLTPISGPSNGTLSINADGSFTYIPNDPNFFGTDQFVYEIFDDGTPEARDQATVIITVFGQNEILAIDDINDTFVNLPVSGSVATNDDNSDGPAGTEVFTLVSGPSNGTLVFNPDGTYTYSPGLDFVGEDTFEYQVCDGGNPIACDTATVYIEVMPIGSPNNEPPVANADTNTTEVDTPVSGNVLPNDFDPDGDPIVVTANTDPANGTLVINPDGSYTYTPDPGFEGEDTFMYTICDNGTPALCDTTTVTIQVIPNNGNITVANDDAYYGFPDMDITGNMLDNDSDPEGDNQSVDNVISPVSGPSNGTVVINTDGSFTYTPNAGYVGTDQFVYENFDDGTPVARDRATVYISIMDPGNEILAIDDINDTFVNLPVSGSVATNDDNSDGPAGTEVFTLVSGPSNGTLVFNPDGTYTYSPGLDFVGEDTFEYQVCDGGNPIACDTATVTIEVVEDPILGNDPPVANNDTNVTQVDTPVNGNVLPNDFDPDGDPIVVTANTDPANGTLVINPDGSYTYTPDPGFEGVDTFMYTICDNGTPSLCDDATVVIYVIPNNGNTTHAVDDAYYGEIDTPLLGNVLDNDTDPQGDNQTVDTTISPVSGPSNGTLVLNADGSFTYTPGSGFTGTDQFVYGIFDDGAPVATSVATAYILIAQTPAPAIAIVKTGIFIDGNQNQCADEGEMIDYTFVVTNQGNVSLANIMVNDPLLGGPIAGPASGDTDGDTELDVTETWIYMASYAITQADIDAGQVTNQATADGTAPSGTVVSDLSDDNSVLEDDPTVVPLCQNADIAIVKTGVFVDGNGNQCADEGEMIDYTFVVTNQGNVSLANIMVNDPLLGGPIAGPASGDTDGDTELDVTETWIYMASYAITQADIDAGQVTNQATADGTAPSGTVVSDLSDDNSVLEDDPTVVPLCQNADIAIVKTGVFVDGNGNQCADEGEMIDYTFVVTNQGNVSLANIMVNDPLLGGPIAGPASGDTDGDTELDVTETWIYMASYAITQADIDAGQVTNQATADGTAPSGTVVSDLSDDNSVLEDDPTVVPLCQNADIAIVKTGVFVDGNGNQCADEGEMIDYTFVVTNQGNVSLANIMVNDPLLGGPIAGPASGDTDGDTELDVTETWIYMASYAITQADIDAGQVTNQATADGTAPSGTVVSDLSDDNSVLEDDPTVVPLCQNADIAIVKTGVFVDGNGNQCADEGEMIDYTFVVTNQGNVSLANIMVNDPLLGGPIAGPASGDTDGDTELDVTETWIYMASYAITQADIDAGQVTNQATADGTAPSGTVVSDLSDDNSVLEDDPTVVTLCQNADIAIVKTGVFVDGNGNQCADEGEMIDYTFVVTNQGNVSLANIMVNDPLLGGPIAGPASGDTDGDTELDVTETWIYMASYVITQADIDAGQVTNQATADGTAPSGTVVSDLSDDNSVLEDDPTVVPLCQNADIAIVKTGVFVDGNGNQCADEGEMIDYTFVVTNQGNVSLANIMVNDPLLGGPIAGPASGDTDGDTELDVTETWIYMASYAITQADIDAGQVTNQATADGTAPSGTVVSDLSDDNSVLEDDPTVVTLCQNASIALIKMGELPVPGGGCPVVGDTILYTFTVVNTGNQSLTNVIVTDPLVAVVGGPISLAVGATDLTSFTASYVITQADVDAGQVVNQATVTADTPSGGQVSDLSDDDVITEDDPTIVDLCQSPVIGLIKVGTVNDENGNGCADVKETITYTFEVFNLGNVTLTNIDVDDPLVNVIGGPITLAPLDSDATSFTAVYEITQGDIDAGFVQNQATATGITLLGQVVSDLSDDNSEFEDDPTVTDLCQNAIIALIKTGVPTDENGNGCVDLGETIVYDFVVTNLGNVTLTNVVVTDPMVAVVGGPIVLAAGISDTETFSAIYTVTQADVDAGFVMNQATAEGTDPNGVVVSDLSDNNSNFEDDPTETTLCQNPMMSLEKTGIWNDDNGDGIPQEGETISYFFSVTNTGNVTLFNITLEDSLPGIILEGGPIAVLEPGETDDTTFTGTYAITLEDIELGEVVNQAIATGQDINGNEVSDHSDDPTNLTNEDINGDGEPDDPTVTILPNVLPESPFEIFNGITPDGDGLNDFFKIVGIENFPNNEMKIYNRWGVLVYETSGYGGSTGNENVFRGFSEGRVTIQDSKELPTGTYFYVLVRIDPDSGEGLNNSGYLYINR